MPIRQNDPCALLVAPMLDYRVIRMCCAAGLIVLRSCRAIRFQSQYFLRVLLSSSVRDGQDLVVVDGKAFCRREVLDVAKVNTVASTH